MRSFANSSVPISLLVAGGLLMPVTLGLASDAGAPAVPVAKDVAQNKDPAVWGSRLPAGTPVPSSDKLKRSPAGAAVGSDKDPASADKATATPINIPLVEGSPGLFLRIPDLDSSGQMRSLFVIGEVSKLDDRNVEIRDSFFETYKDDLSRDFLIEMPKATLDIYSKVLVAKVPVTVWRQEFQLRGASMEFDTETREGGLGGPVEMIIYNGFGGDSSPAAKRPEAQEAAKSKAPK